MAVPQPNEPTFDKPLKLPLSQEELDRINEYLRPLVPEDILRWAVEHIPGLYQTTAFGLTGLVSIDMLSKITTSPPPLIFVDTLYHFPETYELVEEVKKKYNVPVHVYKPEDCPTAQDFEKKHGEKLWERDEEVYDFLVKVRRIVFLDALAPTRGTQSWRTGGTRSSRVRGLRRKGRDHWPPCLAGGRPCQPAAPRGGQHGSAEAEPAVLLELLPRRVVHQREQGATEQAP